MGIAVRTHQRASKETPQIDPRLHTPNGNLAGSVGPESSGGPVMSTPWHAQAWAGWPDGWHTPPMGDTHDAWSGYGYGRTGDALWGRVSTAMSCVDLNSRELGSFPIYGVKNGVPFTLPEWRNNPEPELFASWGDFVHSAVNSLLLRGECITYATGRFADGSVARFATLNPDAVDIEVVDGQRVVSVAGEQIDPRDVKVIRYQSWPGRVRGISPLEWVGRSMSTSGALEDYASQLAERGGVPWAVLKSSRNIDATQATAAQQRWILAAKSRSGAPAVLGNSFDLQTLSLSPTDMALVELREFDERRICAAFGVPAYLVNVSMASGLTYSNAESLFRQHWTATLRPLAGLLAASWSDWLLPRGSSLEFNPDRYTQPPLGERVQAWAQMFNIFDPATGERAITIDEIRAAERMQPADTQPPATADATRLTGATA